MKVTIVHPFPWPEVRRGAERYLDDLSTYLAGAGHDVTILTGTYDQARTEFVSGITIRRFAHLHVPGRTRFSISDVDSFGVRALVPLLRADPGVVHAFTPSAALASRLARRPTLYTILGHPDRQQLPSQRVPRTLFTMAIRRANAVATLSRASLRALEHDFGRDGLVLPPGVKQARFHPDLAARSGPPRLLFSGSLNDGRKRVGLAVRAFAGVLDRHPDARLAISGEGEPDEVRATADALGPAVGAAIDLLGAGTPEEVPLRYRSATVTVLPAQHEAFGLALLESLASGTPAVCAPEGGMPEIVADGTVGRVAAASTPDAMADAICDAITLARDSKTPARCVERARLWEWTDTVGPAHEQLYGLLAIGHPERFEPGPW